MKVNQEKEVNMTMSSYIKVVNSITYAPEIPVAFWNNLCRIRKQEIFP
jgi:hypothetical protein